MTDSDKTFYEGTLEEIRTKYVIIETNEKKIILIPLDSICSMELLDFENTTWVKTQDKNLDENIEDTKVKVIVR